jgi:hypothetical protein
MRLRHPGELVHVDIKKLARISARGAGHRVLGLGERRSQHSPPRRRPEDVLDRLRVTCT